MNRHPRLSIVIATYNSAKTLEKVLQAISRQSIDEHDVELLVVDGGSTDLTLSIAKRFSARIFSNIKQLPAWGKQIGYTHAHGKYVMFLDSDEVIVNRDSLRLKLKAFDNDARIAAVVPSGYSQPNGYPFINQYINEFGDPFSFFMYALSKDARFFLRDMKRRWIVEAMTDDYEVYSFDVKKPLPIFELVAMGSVVDKASLHKVFPNLGKSVETVVHVFYPIVSSGGRVAIMKNDPLLHYSASTLEKYLKKIRSRIINNIFTDAREGFSGRSALDHGVALKKYFFIPYAFSILFPSIDAIKLSVTRRDIRYFLHVFLCFYTASFILYLSVLKLFGIRIPANHYG